MKQRRNQHATEWLSELGNKKILLSKCRKLYGETHPGKNDKATTLHDLRGINSVLVSSGDHEVLRGAEDTHGDPFGQRKQCSVWT